MTIVAEERAIARKWWSLPALSGLPIIPALIFILFVLLGLFGPLLEPHDPTAADLSRSLIPPVWTHGGTWHYALGTDQQGRDILSRLISGARISLIIGFVSVALAGAVGTILAFFAGYYRGWIDVVISRLVDAMFAIPYLLIAIVLAQVVTPGVRNVILILGLTSWAGYARVLRGEVLKVRQQGYIALAQVGGCSGPRIFFRYIFPNIMNTFLVLATLQFGRNILAAATLSFLGVGVTPPRADWGLMLAEGRQYITYAWWLPLFPGIAILLTVLSANLLGDWIAYRLNPKFRQL